MDDALKEAMADHRETMLLSAAEFDDTLEDLVLGGEDPPPQQVWAALRKAPLPATFIHALAVPPCENWGVQPLLDGVLSLLPAPKDRPPKSHRYQK